MGKKKGFCEYFVYDRGFVALFAIYKDSWSVVGRNHASDAVTTVPPLLFPWICYISHISPFPLICKDTLS